MNKDNKLKHIVKEDPFTMVATRLFNKAWNEFRLLRIKKILQAYSQARRNI